MSVVTVVVRALNVQFVNSTEPAPRNHQYRSTLQETFDIVTPEKVRVRDALLL